MKDRYGKPLLMCEVCGEPLEKLFPEGKELWGMDRHPRMCFCRRKEYEVRERERIRREHEAMLERNRSLCFSSKEMLSWNFANDDGSVAAMDHVKNYVEHFEEMKEKHMGLLLWGGVGTGKSFMAACIANALLEKGYTVKMTNFATIINDLFGCDDKNEYIESLMRFTLLIIDDLGAERGTEYATENVFNVIDRRCSSGKPLIVTSNLELSAIKSEPMLDKARIYDRVLEMCIPVCVKGASKRRGIAEDKMEQMKSILNNDGNCRE